VKIKRKFEISADAQAQLVAHEISATDSRLLAARWYLEHDTRHDRLRKVGETSSGDTLWAFSTKETRKRPALLMYLTITGPMQDVTVVHFLLTTGSE
jgi:hypothetical protein